jgi:hypothetical protein
VLLVLQRAEPLLGLGQAGGGGFVAGVEIDLTRIEAGDLALRGRELRLGRRCPGLGGLPGDGQPTDLVFGRRGPGPQRRDLAVQPGEPLAAVRDGLPGRGQGPVLLGDQPFQAGPLGLGLGQPDPVVGQGGGDLRLLGAYRQGFRVERVRIPARDVDVRRRGRVPLPLPGERDGPS